MSLGEPRLVPPDPPWSCENYDCKWMGEDGECQYPDGCALEMDAETLADTRLHEKFDEQ